MTPWGNVAFLKLRGEKKKIIFFSCVPKLGLDTLQECTQPKNVTGFQYGFSDQNQGLSINDVMMEGGWVGVGSATNNFEGCIKTKSPTYLALSLPVHQVASSVCTQ